MDDTTKLSPKLLASLLQLMKAQKGGADLQPESLLGALSAEQQQTAKQVLSDPGKLQAILSSPQVQSLLRALQQHTKPHDGPEL